MTVVSSCQFESYIPVTGLELSVSLIVKSPGLPGAFNLCNTDTYSTIPALPAR